MMDEVLMVIGLACLAIATGWHAILKAYPTALLCAGLTLWLLTAVTPLKIG
jgi:hypothetical protein